MVNEGHIPDGSNLEQYLLAAWGRDGRVGWIIIHELLELAKVHGYDKVFDAIKIAAEANVRNIRYVRGILAKEKKKSEPKKRLKIACSCGHEHYADEPCPALPEESRDVQLNVPSVDDAKRNVAALFKQHQQGGTT